MGAWTTCFPLRRWIYGYVSTMMGAQWREILPPRNMLSGGLPAFGKAEGIDVGDRCVPKRPPTRYVMSRVKQGRRSTAIVESLFSNRPDNYATCCLVQRISSPNNSYWKHEDDCHILSSGGRMMGNDTNLNACRFIEMLELSGVVLVLCAEELPSCGGHGYYGASPTYLAKTSAT